MTSGKGVEPCDPTLRRPPASFRRRRASAISTGVYGYPKQEACALAVAAAAEWLGAHELPRTVTFCCFGADDKRLYRETLGTSNGALVSCR